jgi:WD40 repeat protein
MNSNIFFDFSLEKSIKIIDHKDEIRVIEFSTNNKWFASGSWDNRVILWKIIDNEGTKIIQKQNILHEHSSSITSLKFSRDNRYLISGSKDGTVKIWDIYNEKYLFTLNHDDSKVFSIDMGPKNNYILSAGEDRDIFIWKIIKDRNKNWIKIEKAKIIKSDKYPKEKIHVIKVNSRIQIFASIGDENIIYLWDYPSGKLNYRLEGHRKIIYTFDFHPNLPYLISGGMEKNVFIWNLETKKVIKKIQTDSSTSILKFSDDGRFFLTVSLKNEIKIYDFNDQKILQKHKINEGSMLTAGISNDWSILAISPFKKQPISIRIIFNRKKNSGKFLDKFN